MALGACLFSGTPMVLRCVLAVPFAEGVFVCCYSLCEEGGQRALLLLLFLTTLCSRVDVLGAAVYWNRMDRPG